MSKFMVGYCYASGLDANNQPDHAKAGFRPEFWAKSYSEALKKLKSKFAADRELEWADCSDAKNKRKRLAVNGEKTGWVIFAPPELYGLVSEGVVCETGTAEEMRLAAEKEAIKDSGGKATKLKWKKGTRGDKARDLFDGTELTPYEVRRIL